MSEIIIYTKSTCPYCISSKQLLKDKLLKFVEISVDGRRDLQMDMAVKAHGRSTVPQIFINGHPVGGCDDLYALEESGKLDGILAAS